MTVKAYNSLDEMMNDIAKAAERNRRIDEVILKKAPWKFATKPGDHIIYGYADVPFLFGKVEDVSEYPEDVEALARDNRVMVTGYSHMCPTGEMGSIAISSIQGWMDEETFNTLRNSCGDETSYVSTLIDLIPAMQAATEERIKECAKTRS